MFQVASSDAESDISEGFVPSSCFPSHVTLLKDQQEYSRERRPVLTDDAGVPLPYPCHTLKKDLCNTDALIKVDKHALQVVIAAD